MSKDDCRLAKLRERNLREFRRWLGTFILAALEVNLTKGDFDIVSVILGPILFSDQEFARLLLAPHWPGLLPRLREGRASHDEFQRGKTQRDKWIGPGFMVAFSAACH
ncbi:MAG TPA: hypothetical protein VGN61_14460 [Verrucomicrobiae bacterium]|jgi:hypothetical protein